MKKILITYATRPLGLRVAKLLSGIMQVQKAASLDEVPSVLRQTYATIPKGSNPVYAHELLKLALDKGCTYVLPLGLDEIQSLSEATVLFEEYGIKVLCPSRDTLSDVNVLSAPTSDLELRLIVDKEDMLTRKKLVTAEWDGLCLVSDSENEFILVVV